MAAAVVGTLSAFVDLDYRAFFSLGEADIPDFFRGPALGLGRPSLGSGFLPEGFGWGVGH